jgi:hypothetical protein
MELIRQDFAQLSPAVAGNPSLTGFQGVARGGRDQCWRIACCTEATLFTQGLDCCMPAGRR